MRRTRVAVIERHAGVDDLTVIGENGDRVYIPFDSDDGRALVEAGGSFVAQGWHIEVRLVRVPSPGLTDQGLGE